MIIHDIRFTSNEDGSTEYLVGATDENRWDWEIDDGQSGHDAATLVWASYTINPQPYAPEAKVGFHNLRDEETKFGCYLAVQPLMEITKALAERKITEEQAHATLFGYSVEGGYILVCK